MNKAKFISFASVISEIQQSDLFMTVKARILETPKANLNGAAVTPAFVDDIIANEERYVGLPLYADIKALESGKFNRLGHLYDSKTGEFHSTQIGSFYQFEKEDFEGGSYLVGYARIPKRNKKLSKAIAELFADGALKFSFEIACGDYEESEDGTFVIDASENNYLEGTAIVTFPACEDAVALEFVAQREADADDTERGEKEMAEAEKLEQEAVETTEEVAEASEPQEEKTAEVEEVSSEESNEATETVAEATQTVAETPAEEQETETAAVYVTETHVEETRVDMYDTETDKGVSQTIEVRTTVHSPVEGNIVETDDGIAVAEESGETSKGAENDSGESGETPAEEPSEEPAEAPAAEETPAQGEDVPGTAAEDPKADGKAKRTAEKRTEEEMFKTIAELAETVKALAEEVKSLKEQKVVAQQKAVAETINPFMDSMSTNGNRYDLLERVERNTDYSLLTR